MPKTAREWELSFPLDTRSYFVWCPAGFILITLPAVALGAIRTIRCELFVLDKVENVCRQIMSKLMALSPFHHRA